MSSATRALIGLIKERNLPITPEEKEFIINNFSIVFTMNITEAINNLAVVVHQIAVDHGWWETERNFGEQVALQHSELSEVLEEYRVHGLKPEKLLYATVSDNKIVSKPEGIAAEYADCIIRILDTCAKYNIPIALALEKKIEYNRTRPYRHGNKIA